MPNNETIKAFALEAVGCTYVYGATGQKCTPSYRKARMEQYPNSASAIKKNCPVLSGKTSTCDGCKYNGKKAYDCAQLSRYAATAAGLELPSGASSQWKKGDWAQKGTIDTLPLHQVCFLYLERASAKPMGHTGVYLGDGTAVDARGHSAGVVHAALDDVGWTHWAILNGQEIEPEPEEKTETGEGETHMLKFRVTGTRLALRKEPTTSAPLVKKSGKDVRMDTGTEIMGDPVNAEWVKVSFNGLTGYSMAKYLQAVRPVHPNPPTVEIPSEEPSDSEKLEILWNWYKKEVGA